MEKDPIPNHIDIYYEKNPHYRTVYADGLFGGITPTGAVNLSFFATRNTIPKSVKHEIGPNGVLSNTPGTNSPDSKIGIMREIEIGVYMNRQTAQDIYDFLQKLLGK